MSPFVKKALSQTLPAKELSSMSTLDVIRALRGEREIVCEPGCPCRGSYAGDDRRRSPRHAEVN